MREYHQKAQCPRSNNKSILEKGDGEKEIRIIQINLRLSEAEFPDDIFVKSAVWAGDITRLVECLIGTHQAMSLIPSTT